MSTVLYLPACLCVRRSVPWLGSPTGPRQTCSTTAGVPDPSVIPVAVKETNKYPGPENLKSIAECRGGL